MESKESISLLECRNDVSSHLKYYQLSSVIFDYRTYREKRNRITYFFRAPYMVLVVGRISTVTTSLSYKQRGMAAKLI